MRFCSFIRLQLRSMIKEQFHVMSLSLLPSMLGTFWSFQYIALHGLLQNYQMQAAANTNTECRNAGSVKQSFFLFWYYLLGFQTGLLHFLFHFFEFFTWELLQSTFPIFNCRSEITVQRRSSFQIKNKEVWLRWQGGLETQAWIFKPHLSILLWILLPSLQKILS